MRQQNEALYEEQTKVEVVLHTNFHQPYSSQMSLSILSIIHFLVQNQIQVQCFAVRPSLISHIGIRF